MITLETNLGNMEGVLGVMIPIVAIVGGLGFAMASRYLKSKERMEMISRGMDVSAFKDPDFLKAWSDQGRSSKRSPLRRGLVWLGVGLGLSIGYIICHTVLKSDGNEDAVIYFGSVSIFVGLGLIISHMIEGKDTSKQNSQ